MAKHYVDNRKLFEAIVQYRKALAQQRHQHKPTPVQIPEYVGECLLMIANRLANKPNFANYTFKDEMVSDSVENCIQYFHNFDPEKSQNPFAYFTQIIHYAFLRRIERERRHSYIKYKYAVHQANMKEDHATMEGDTSYAIDSAWASYENIHDFIQSYEDKLTKTKHSRAPRPDEDAEPTLDFFDPPDTYVDGVPVEREDDLEEETV